jgi:hypothetical protein
VSRSRGIGDISTIIRPQTRRARASGRCSVCEARWACRLRCSASWELQAGGFEGRLSECLRRRDGHAIRYQLQTCRRPEPVHRVGSALRRRGVISRAVLLIVGATACSASKPAHTPKELELCPLVAFPRCRGATPVFDAQGVVRWGGLVSVASASSYEARSCSRPGLALGYPPRIPSPNALGYAARISPMFTSGPSRWRSLTPANVSSTAVTSAPSARLGSRPSSTGSMSIHRGLISDLQRMHRRRTC